MFFMWNLDIKACQKYFGEHYSLFFFAHIYISKSGSSKHVLSYNLTFSLNKVQTSFYSH